MFKVLATAVVVSLVIGTSTSAQNNDAILRERLDGSWAVVTGRVLDIKKLGDLATSVSEHNADWHYADIAVGSVLKSTALAPVPGTRLRVYFPASRDIAWYTSPKFQKGQTGIWILRPAGAKVKERDADAKASLDPLDFQPLSQLKKVKDLLRR